METIEKVVNLFKNFTLTTLFFLILNLALVVVFWELWNSNRVFFWVGLAIYAVVLLIGGYIWKVWGAVEPETIAYFADFIRKWVREFSPGFPRKYKKEVINRHRFFNTKGLRTKAGAVLQLQRVFIELDVDVSDPQNVKANPLALRVSENKRQIWNYISQLKQQPLKVLSVIGPPGCGKSTLLQYVALTLAGNRQRQYRVPTLIPLLLFLRDHIKPIVEENVTLAELAQRHFSNTTLYPNLQPPANWFQKELEKGRMLVLLDGLDEVSNVEERLKVSAWVDAQIAINEKCYFILTARPQGYRDAPLEHTNVLKVQPLNPIQVSNFIHNWYLATKIIATGENDKGVRQDAKREAQDLLQRLRERPNLNDLTMNPLLLTMITIVHNHRAVLPGQRVELYEEICDVFLERWQAARHIPDLLSAAQKREALEPLAAHMMNHGGADHNRWTLNTAEVLGIIKPYLVAVGILESEHLSFLKNLNDNSGIFTEVEVGEWGFSHKTFQEYLCATHWCKHPESVPKDWDKMIEDVWWQETLLLYAAQGDATHIAEICLTKNTLKSLTFVASLADEALKLKEDIRQVIKNRFDDNLTSEKPGLRRLAAEVTLQRRLKTGFILLNEYTFITTQFISCAEYQLFIDEKRQMGYLHQPYHWNTYSFSENGLGPKDPITGVSMRDALLFCEWLSKRTGNYYRLPNNFELEDGYNGNVLELISKGIIRKNEVLSNKIKSFLIREDKFVEINLEPLLILLQVAFYYDLQGGDNSFIEQQIAIFDTSFHAKHFFNATVSASLSTSLNLYFNSHLDFDLNYSRNLAGNRQIAYNRRAARKLILNLADNLSQKLNINIDINQTMHKRRLFSQDIQQVVSRLKEEISGISTQEKSLPEKSINKTINLINLLTEVAKSNSVQLYLQNNWKYHQCLYRYVYEGASLQKKSIWLWWKKDIDVEIVKRTYAFYYWFYTLLLERQAGKLPSWEGIRLVRDNSKFDF